MCGIFGAINFNGYWDHSDYMKFVQCTDIVRHRGPDDKSYLAYPSKDRLKVFLGHRRLSIIDLSVRGRQPLTDDQGRWIVFNGEIYNYIELRERLEQMGERFYTDTDTEVILKWYKRFDCQGFKDFNGMWAFAIFDSVKNKLILSRDRFSVKPLYYLYLDGLNQLLFSSEIKQLIPFLPVKEINRDVMYRFLLQSIQDDGSETFFKGVYQVPAKHSVIIDLDTGKRQYMKYWDYSEGVEQKADYVERFRDLFIDSIRLRLRSDVKVGVLLSGGLDSSSIALVANQLTGNDLEAFTVVSKEKKYSEERFVDILAQQRNVKVTKLYFAPDEAMESIEDVIRHQDEPFGSLNVIAQYKIYKLIKEKTDIKVVLSGQGGDESLCGYKKFFFFYLQELLKHFKYLSATNELLHALTIGTIIRQISVAETKRYLPFVTRAARLRNFVLINGSLAPIWKAETLIERQKSDIDRFSIPALAHYEDRNSMASSIESRFPFLDYRIVDFSVNLPSKMKIKNGWTKYILRKALYELPPAIRWRKDKQGFTTPEEKWLKEDLKVRIYQLFQKSVLEEMGLIDSKKFLEVYDLFLNGDKTIWHKDISKVLIAEIWARSFFK